VKCVCIKCGKEFIPKTKNRPAKFCSYRCNSIVNGYQKGHRFYRGGEKGWIRKGQRLSRKTEFKSRGKGGRYKIRGYVLVYVPNHPFKTSADSVFEHRLVVEKYLGRYLTKDEVVHHKNHIKDDNRIGNLEVINKKLHSKLHWDEKLKKFSVTGTKCGHYIKNEVKIEGNGKWIKVGFCPECNQFLYVDRPEGIWKKLK